MSVDSSVQTPAKQEKQDDSAAPVKLTKAARVALYSSSFQPAIIAAASELHEAEETLAEKQRNVGRNVSAAVVSWTAAGGTAEEIQKLVLRDIGRDYAWSYVSSWQRAAIVFDALTPAMQEKYGESIEGLKSLGRVSDEEKRQDLAEKLAAKGTVGVRAIREAADKLNGAGKSKRKRATSAGAETLVTKLRKVRDEVKQPVSVKWTAELQDYVNALVLIGVRVGRDGKVPTTPQKQAAETLAYFGPTK